MSLILFVLMLANSIAAIYSVAMVAVIVTAMFFDFKAMHPEWEPKQNEPKEIAKAAIMCVLLFLCPIFNVVFAQICMNYQHDLREIMFEKMEEELREQNYNKHRA